MRKPKVAILTSLTDYSPAYSLTGVILDQARMLHRAGYDYELMCLEYFNPNDRAEIEREGLNATYKLGRTILHDYQPFDEPKEDTPTQQGFYKQVDVYFNGDSTGLGYKQALEPFDVIITHDLMFLSWYVPENQAIRMCADLWPDKRWLHWCHSAPTVIPGVIYPSKLRFEGCRNSMYISLNHRQRQDVANMFGITPQDVGVVYNPKDIRDLYNFHADTCDFIQQYDILDHEILQVYPFSTPRFGAKGVRHLLRIFGFWKKLGVRARLVLVNAHCNQDIDRPHEEEIIRYAESCGLEIDRDVILTSRFARSRTDTEEGRHRYGLWTYSVPRKVVQELMLAANMFIFPSISEACSLIQAEASIAGKFVVLNRNFVPMMEFGSPNTMHYEFTGRDPDQDPGYYEAVAREMWAHLQRDHIFTNTTLARTRTYNRDWIWRHQLEPLLYIGFSGS